MNSTEMIDRYVNEVGENLPRKMRADIEMELRSLLLDALEERAGGEPSVKETAVLLQEFGSPEKMAAQYRPAESLIGPKLFPTYKVVVTITVTVIGVLHLVGLGFVLWQSAGADFVDKSLNFIFSFGQSAILNAGIVTLIFAIIERSAGDEINLPEQEKTWDPFALPPVKDPNRIDRGELVVGLIVSLLVLSWLNLFPNWFGGAQLDGELPWYAQLMTAEFLQQIPWLSASLLVDVLLKTAVLIQGRWNQVTRWLELATLSFGLYVTVRIFNLEAISTVSAFTNGIKMILAIVIIVELVEVVVKLFRLVFGRPFPRPSFIKSRLV
ncbi:MAG: hypothetical protein IPJ90_20180 [Anaerolineaceae bacterium]|nr:hypothetical protein [Anaerolineaceae bacterium]